MLLAHHTWFKHQPSYGIGDRVREIKALLDCDNKTSFKIFSNEIKRNIGKLNLPVWPTGVSKVVDVYPLYKKSKKPHTGTDFPTTIGTKVMAVSKGKVTVVVNDQNNNTYNEINRIEEFDKARKLRNYRSCLLLRA
ncbi:MAG: hypothetical protein A2Y15_06490 [Clostridiales bacterium GWF2_36_10]|nr:MAG: hypothetical protein A2Y15_06490 [Clostridiales bacterium GWF2_36_10]HAN20642.1 hypothetical protein [Clostridiales bacterium]